MAISSELAGAVSAFRHRLTRVDWSSQSPSRRHILEVFLVLALERGINSVSMRMIAQVIGIKAPSIYSHFPDGRNEILAEASRWHFYKFGSALLTELSSIENADDALSTMIKVHVTRQLTLPESNLWDLLMATDKMVHTLPAQVRDEADEMVSLYEDLYYAVASDMGLEQPGVAISVLMTLLEGATRWCGSARDSASVKDAVERAQTLARIIFNSTAIESKIA